MADWRDWIGRSAAANDVATPAAVARFAATLDSGAPADAVPQGFHWCLCLPDAATAALGADGHPAKGGFLPPVDLPRRMWAASEVEFVAPIPVGGPVERISTVADITEKRGGSGRLVFVTVAHETRADGTLAVRERQSIVYREPSAAPAPLPPVGDADLSGWEWARTLVPSEALLFRYSALTFNSHRIHYDRPYATAGEGYPGLVVHGPLQATLLLDLAARQLGPQALATFSYRAQSPAYAGQPLHLVGRRDGATLTLATLGGDGRTCVSATATVA
jgi:3-methylfumaryl-CoA hydratase